MQNSEGSDVQNYDSMGRTPREAMCRTQMTAWAEFRGSDVQNSDDSNVQNSEEVMCKIYVITP